MIRKNRVFGLEMRNDTKRYAMTRNGFLSGVIVGGKRQNAKTPKHRNIETSKRRNVETKAGPGLDQNPKRERGAEVGCEGRRTATTAKIEPRKTAKTAKKPRLSAKKRGWTAKTSHAEVPSDKATKARSHGGAQSAAASPARSRRPGTITPKRPWAGGGMVRRSSHRRGISVCPCVSVNRRAASQRTGARSTRRGAGAAWASRG